MGCVPRIYLKEIGWREKGHCDLNRTGRLHTSLPVELPDIACRGSDGSEPATRRGAHDREAVRIDVNWSAFSRNQRIAARISNSWPGNFTEKLERTLTPATANPCWMKNSLTSGGILLPKSSNHHQQFVIDVVAEPRDVELHYPAAATAHESFPYRPP